MPSNGRYGFSHRAGTRCVTESPDGKSMSALTYKGYSVVYHYVPDFGWLTSVIRPDNTGTQWVWGRTQVESENNFAAENPGYDWVRTHPPAVTA